MTVLVLGGTQFIGRHIVEKMLRGGHAVTTLNRGQSIYELPPQVERLWGDRTLEVTGLDALSDRQWEMCIDVSGRCLRMAVVWQIQPCRPTVDVDGVHERPGGEHLVWVPSEFIRAGGVTEFELPLYRC